MPYSKIKRYYFTVCIVLLVLLVLLMMIRNNWTMTPQALLSTLVGWLLICAVIIGVIYLMVARRGGKKGTDSDGTEEKEGRNS